LVLILILFNGDENANNDEDERAIGDTRKTVMVKGPIIVDPEASLQFGNIFPSPPSYTSFNQLTGSDYLILGEAEPRFTGDCFGNQADDEKNNETDPDEFLLYPPRILGYSTREKIWG
jgi:hypothetical protein